MILHGLIHLMGFSKAFGLAQLEQLSQEISRARGLWWLAAAILIVLGVLSFLFRQSWWWMPGLLGAIISQILIFSHWSDARIGTFPNLILIIVAVLGFGAWNFKQSVRVSLKELGLKEALTTEVISPEKTATLPPPVGRWLERSGALNGPEMQRVYLRQEGRMRTAPQGKWMLFDAEQWFRTDKPAFLWYARVGAGSPVRLNGRDQLLNERGHMLIKLFGLVPVVDAKGPQIDQASLLRYLAEMIWFPAAALEPYLTWEAVDDRHAKATIKTGDLAVTGTFTFNDAGDVVAFEALRYYEQKGNTSLELWHIDIDQDSYHNFQGVRIPTKSAVSWKLKSGDFRWLELEITDLQFNQ